MLLALKTGCAKKQLRAAQQLAEGSKHSPAGMQNDAKDPPPPVHLGIWATMGAHTIPSDGGCSQSTSVQDAVQTHPSAVLGGCWLVQRQPHDHKAASCCLSVSGAKTLPGRPWPLFWYGLFAAPL